MNNEYFKFTMSDDTRRKIEEVSHAIAGDIKFVTGDDSGDQVGKFIDEIRKAVAAGIPMMVNEMVSMINKGIEDAGDGGSEDPGIPFEDDIYEHIYGGEEDPAVDRNGNILSAGDKVTWTDPETGEAKECTVYGEASDGMVRLVSQYGEYEALPSECELIIEL